jgi:hypothetical protein
VAGGKRLSTRLEADLVSIYPGLNPFLLSEEEKVGLYLNRERAEWRLTWRLTVAFLWAQHRGRLPAEMFDAAADSEVEAALLEYETNKRR